MYEADFAMDRVREALIRHGYTEEQVREAAGILPARVAEPSVAER